MGFSKFDTTKVWFSVGFGTVSIMMNSNQMETWNEDNVICRNTNDYCSCNSIFSNCDLIQEKNLGLLLMASALALVCSAIAVYGSLYTTFIMADGAWDW